jgi:hypothetical protein
LGAITILFSIAFKLLLVFYHQGLNVLHVRNQIFTILDETYRLLAIPNPDFLLLFSDVGLASFPGL